MLLEASILYDNAHCDSKSFDQILEAFRHEVTASGVSDEDLDHLFASARQESLASAPQLAANLKSDDLESK